ncbi:trimethylamine-N-oxide reductase TorA, partial [Salmonella enterica subsp. enterica serovar Infantis]
DPENHPLNTARGKLELSSARSASYGSADCPGPPRWLVPDEWHGNADAGQVQRLAALPALRLHSQLNYSSLRERFAVAGREPV